MLRSPFAKFVAAGLAITLFASLTWAVGGFKAVRSAYHRITGETILVDEHTKSFGVVAPGDRIAFSFKLTNTGSTPVRIAGCESACGCVMPTDLPFVLNPNESRDFPISIHNPNLEGAMPRGSLSLPLNLFTTNPAQPRIRLTVKGEVRPPSTSSASSP